MVTDKTAFILPTNRLCVNQHIPFLCSNKSALILPTQKWNINTTNGQEYKMIDVVSYNTYSYTYLRFR